MHFIELIERVLQAYQKTGRAIHLAHAARALDEARATVQTSAEVRSTRE